MVFDDRAPNADADYDEVYAPLLGFGIGCDVIPCRSRYSGIRSSGGDFLCIDTEGKLLVIEAKHWTKEPVDAGVVRRL